MFQNLGGANSVLRSCADELLYRNGQHDLEGGNLTVWYRSCTMDLCNNAPSFSKGATVIIYEHTYYLYIFKL